MTARHPAVVAAVSSAADPLGDEVPFSGLPPADRARLLALGPVWNDDIVGHRAETVRCYTDVLAGRDQAPGGVVRDLPYGAAPRQVLDIFTPAPTASPAPVVVFVHGGAFTRGGKSANGHVYDNVLHWFARHGYVGVNVEYRLAPDILYPDGARDVALALEWVAAQIADWGGDAARVHVIGHSAGGTHVASLAVDPAVGRAMPPGVRTLALISGRLRIDALPDNPNARHVAAYCGDDAGLYAERSPVTHAARCPLPVLVAVAEYENRHLDAYGAEFAEGVRAAGQVPVRFLRLAGHNHTSIVAHINSGEDRLARALDVFFRDHDGSPQAGAE
ncbi:alpha/beta hydrolase [Gluconacetobacter azotocaptans]|uniref:Alpha/beta hydrolase n=1 Tax=Gluconacetobacter azotocaptans TaxID=142834 RepID=A0A7W4JT41_9PROT|nr:alpha/beta hydrolase [Gluconacetobacter azotocaptans]MBB2190446.1 alpha/beta hydrolase [Gluconacetobacter azotocaptans]MBM9400517.1 alpha/beta hydrolase [Gluconacetobacter azotocaptans]GBQ30247.1 esterase/lipase [Gluconacetobacter azotocaptans DSM 13594]